MSSEVKVDEQTVLCLRCDTYVLVDEQGNKNCPHGLTARTLADYEAQMLMS